MQSAYLAARATLIAAREEAVADLDTMTQSVGSLKATVIGDGAHMRMVEALLGQFRLDEGGDHGRARDASSDVTGQAADAQDVEMTGDA